jgi:hypothetical protein
VFSFCQSSALLSLEPEDVLEELLDELLAPLPPGVPRPKNTAAAICPIEELRPAFLPKPEAARPSDSAEGLFIPKVAIIEV